MPFNENDSTAQSVPLELWTPPVVTAETLRRAARFGERAAARRPAVPFDEVETELRDAWARREGSGLWPWVRDAVRAGYEQAADGP